MCVSLYVHAPAEKTAWGGHRGGLIHRWTFFRVQVLTNPCRPFRDLSTGRQRSQRNQ